MSGRLILSNGLTDRPDEGFLNVANSLVKRLKKAQPETLVVSYERQSAVTDRFLKLNKLLLNRSLHRVLRQQRQPVLYIPFPAPTLYTALRIFLLSLFARWGLSVILVMKSPYHAIARLLLRWSRAEVVALSGEAADFYRGILPEHRVKHLKAGVDTTRFSPVSPERQQELKQQYGFDPDRPVVLHVGHLNRGRGVGELLKLDSRYQVLLVTSTLTANEQDGQLKQELLACDHIRLLDDYIPHIEDIYRLCDVYFFPTREEGRCIDVPLSCLEAAACGKPVVATDYGELKAFAGQDGFYPIPAFTPEALNGAVQTALTRGGDSRQAVLDYDWDGALSRLTE